MRWWIYGNYVEVMKSYREPAAKRKERSHWRLGHWLNHIIVDNTPAQWDNVDCIQVQLVHGMILWI